MGRARLAIRAECLAEEVDEGGGATGGETEGEKEVETDG